MAEKSTEEKGAISEKQAEMAFNLVNKKVSDAINKSLDEKIEKRALDVKRRGVIFTEGGSGRRFVCTRTMGDKLTDQGKELADSHLQTFRDASIKSLEEEKESGVVCTNTIYDELTDKEEEQEQALKDLWLCLEEKKERGLVCTKKMAEKSTEEKGAIFEKQAEMAFNLVKKKVSDAFNKSLDEKIENRVQRREVFISEGGRECRFVCPNRMGDKLTDQGKELADSHLQTFIDSSIKSWEEKAESGVVCIKKYSKRQRQEESSSGKEIWKRQKGLSAEQTENAAPDWENVYSPEEKRLKFLVDRQGYGKWEKRHNLWEIENGLVPIAEEVSPEEEKRQKDLEAKRQMQKEILLALSSRSLEDQKKQEEAFYKRLEELRIKPLTEEEKKLKQTYLENVEKVRLGIIDFEDFCCYGPGWDLAFYDVPSVELDSEPEPTPPPTPQLCCKKEKRCSTPVSSNFAAEERCVTGSYLTPYCKCDTICCKYNITPQEHPPEIAPIWHAYSRQCRQSHCFDIDDCTRGSVCPLAPFKNFRGKAGIMMELANRAIQEYNEKECNVYKYKLLKIEKVNHSVSMYNTYWMTVKVLNLTLGTPIETFQIHAAFSYVNDDREIYCCRPREQPVVGLPSCEFCFGLLPGRVTGGEEP